MTVAPLTLTSSHEVVQLPEPDVSVPSAADPMEFTVPGARAGAGTTVPEIPEDLTAVSTRELRILSNQLYRVLDTDFPPFGMQEHYEDVVEVLTVRQAHAVEATETDTLREKFRDNSVSSRFELFHDGTMVGYVKYDMRSGRVRLLETVVGPAYARAGLEPVLVRAALLNIHHRRLAPIPYCRHAQAFLAANPQFRALIPSS